VVTKKTEFSISGGFRWATAAGLITLMALSACQSSNLGLGGSSGNRAANNTPVMTPNPKGEVFGQGTVRISLLIPKSAPGNAARVASEIRNGALLAMKDFGQNTLQLVIKDTEGQAAPAQQAASEAVQEGSSAILGPLFAANVSAASGIAQPANVTMLAFSTDSSVARSGVYLLSYTPQDDTRRILNYSISQGARSIVAYLPDSAEGLLRANVLRQIAGSAGASVNIFKYSRSTDSIRKVVGESAAVFSSSNAIYIPDGGAVPNVILSSLKQNGLKTTGKQILGSGNWETVKTTDPLVAGAVYPGRDITNFNTFSSRYETNYNSKPGHHAALGYDAVTLMSELVRQNGPQKAFRKRTLETKRGFAGINGIFRLRSNGTSQRGLAVYQIIGGKGQLVSPAPRSFSLSGT